MVVVWTFFEWKTKEKEGGKKGKKEEEVSSFLVEVCSDCSS